MATRAFVDTNVLVYLYDIDEIAKRARARELLLDSSHDLIISAQVLNEFYVTVTCKISTPLSTEAATKALASLAELEVVPITRNLVVDAVSTGTRHQLSHWDALIVESASRAGAETLFTEDLSSGSAIQGVTISNPFASLD